MQEANAKIPRKAVNRVLGKSGDLTMGLSLSSTTHAGVESLL